MGLFGGMKKRGLSLLLATVLCLSLLPTAAFAATEKFGDGNVTWLGSQAEYQKTLDAMFTLGLRKVQVGNMTTGGLTNTKFGMVDATGTFVVPPIYDEIRPYSIELDPDRDPVYDYAVEDVFLNGYTQAKRDGKMGLLNTLGQEAVPCRYDAVGMPSEGISRVILGGKLGYWSLLENRELVAPKYPVAGANAMAAGMPISYDFVDQSAALSSLMLQQNAYLGLGAQTKAQYDFNDGYALVPYGGTQKSSRDGYATSGNIIDKSGKEVLKGGPYLYRSERGYPQYGPYLVYCVLSDKDFFWTDDGNTNIGNAWESGVIGPDGVVLKAQYTGGIRHSMQKWPYQYMGDARITVLPEEQRIILAKDMEPGHQDGGAVGVVDFSGKTVIPFVHDYNFLQYNPEYKIFFDQLKDGGDVICDINGKQLHSAFEYGDGQQTLLTAGYTMFSRHHDYRENGQYKAYFNWGYVNLKTGEEWIPGPIKAQGETSAYKKLQFANEDGLFWMMDQQNKWGLYKFGGEQVLPHVYDWANNGNTQGKVYTLVKQDNKYGLIGAGGKVLLPCEYKSITTSGERYFILATTDGKFGFYDIATEKTAVPPTFYKPYGTNGIGDAYGAGAQAVQSGKEQCFLIDTAGNKLSDTYIFLTDPYRGLWVGSTLGHQEYIKDHIGADGKVVYPAALGVDKDRNYPFEGMTVVVKDGRVGAVSASLLARPTQPKAATAQNAAAAPSPTKLTVNGSAVSVDVYAIAGNNYIKLRDLATLVNGTGKNFEVAWDGGKNAINLKSGAAYTAVGGELAPGNGQAKAATLSTSAIYKDGLRLQLSAYTIVGNNYFKLRDVMSAFDIGVGYAGGIATIDTSVGYTPTEAEQVGMVAAPAAPGAEYEKPADKPADKPIYKEPFAQFQATPDKVVYAVGDPFEIAGFKVAWLDVYGKGTSIVNDVELKIGDVKIYDGYKFTSAGTKNVDCYYQGQKLNNFTVTVTSAEALPDGRYTISCMGSYFRVVRGWLELQNEQPAQVFTVTNKGKYYTIKAEGGGYVGFLQKNNGKGGEQLVTGGAYPWIIQSVGNGTYSIRAQENKRLIVNAKGNSGGNGTHIIVWLSDNYGKDTAKNAQITFTPVN